MRRISSSRTTSTSRASRAIFRRVRGLATADHCALHERPLACLRGEDAKAEAKSARRDDDVENIFDRARAVSPSRGGVEGGGRIGRIDVAVVVHVRVFSVALVSMTSRAYASLDAADRNEPEDGRTRMSRDAGAVREPDDRGCGGGVGVATRETREVENPLA